MTLEQTRLKVRVPKKWPVATVNVLLGGGGLDHVDMVHYPGVAFYGKITSAFQHRGGLVDISDRGGHGLEKDNKGLA